MIQPSPEIKTAEDVWEHWRDEVAALLDEWLHDETLSFDRVRIRKRLGCGRVTLLRVIGRVPEFKRTYEEGKAAKIELAELDLIEAAAGSAEPLEKDRAFQAEFVVRAFSPRYIRRQEMTGADGAPISVTFEKK
jgi:hypothetical protein